MTFTVVWKPEAERSLAGLWLNASDRQAITEAGNAIDALLRTAPLEVGESRVSNMRILTVCPLSIYYDVRKTFHIHSVAIYPSLAILAWIMISIRSHYENTFESSTIVRSWISIILLCIGLLGMAIYTSLMSIHKRLSDLERRNPESTTQP